MLSISVQTNIDQVVRDLEAFADQVPYATALALTRTAQFTKQKLIEEMPRAFKNPSRFTLNSLYVKPARKSDLVAFVKIKDEAFKADPPTKWLRPHIYGGGRPYKRSEQLLRSRGILPSGLYAVPGAKARRTARGSMSRGQIQQVLSALSAARDQFQSSTAGSKKRNRGVRGYFAIRDNSSHLRPGVYRRVGATLEPVLMFVKSPRYRRRFDFYGIGERTIAMRFPIEFKRALREAARTAR